MGGGIGDYAVAWLTTVPRITVTESDDSRFKVLAGSQVRCRKCSHEWRLIPPE